MHVEVKTDHKCTAETRSKALHHTGFKEETRHDGMRLVSTSRPYLIDVQALLLSSNHLFIHS